MKIVVLDGHTLNPGDLSWEDLRALGEVMVYPRTSPVDLCTRAAEAEILLTNKAPIARDDIFRLSNLRYIGVTATGYNIVDVKAARERNIPVSNVPTYGTRSVAQMTFALILELSQHVGHHARTVREGRWAVSDDFCYWDFPLLELEGLTLGILGLGRIGRAVGELGRAFGMNVIAHSRSATAPDEFRSVSLKELFTESDFLSLHCPLTPETKEIMNAGNLRLMKRTAFLINSSRGPLINEEALALALNEERIAGAALDVLSVEPPRKNHPLFSAKNCLITPHIAWATKAARARLLRSSVENVRAFQSGHPKNVVN